jgi:hypothetical protein
MTKRTLLEEIRRIHEISGIKSEILVEGLINEAADPITKEMARIITSFFTGMEKEIIVAGRKIGQKKAEQIVSKIGSKTLTADEVAVVKALTKEVISADAAIIGRLTSDIFGEMQKLTSRTAKTKYFSEVKAALKGILPDEEVKNVVSGVTSKVKAGTTTTGSSTSSGAGGKVKPKPEPNNVLKPDPNANVPSAPDVLPSNANEIIAATAASSAEAKAFMEQVKLLGFDEKITKILQLEYSKFYNLSAAELIKEGNALVKQLNEKNYGWIKRGWSKVTDNPSEAIGKAGKASYKAILWYTVIGLAMTGSAIVYAIKNKVEDATGVKGSDILPDVKVPDLSKKDDSNKQTSGIDDSVQGLRNFFKQKYDGYDDTAVNALDIKSLGSSKYEITKDGTKLTFTYSNGTFTRQ